MRRDAHIRDKVYLAAAMYGGYYREHTACLRLVEPRRDGEDDTRMPSRLTFGDSEFRGLEAESQHNRHAMPPAGWVNRFPGMVAVFEFC